MSSFISDLLRVIPLAIEERISRSICLDSVLSSAPSYIKSSMWRTASPDTEAEIARNRNHVQNYAFLFMLSLVSCLGFSAPICYLSSVFYTRFSYEGLDNKSSLQYGAVVSSTDFSLAFSIILVHFYGWNRRFVVILVTVYVLSTVFYFLSFFFIGDKQYIGILFLFVWRIVLGFSGTIQMLDVSYCCNSNIASFLLIGGHTTTHIYTWNCYGPMLGLVFINTGQLAFDNKESITKLLFNSFTAYSWVNVILMIICGVYFNSHYYVIKKKDKDGAASLDRMDTRTSITLESAETSNSINLYNSIYTSDICCLDGISTGTKLFNSMNASALVDQMKDVSFHKEVALSLIRTSIILLLCSEALLVFVFYGFVWNLFTIALSLCVFSDSFSVYKAYISVILGSFCAILFSWETMSSFFSRYSHSFFPRISYLGVFLVVFSSVLLLIAVMSSTDNFDISPSTSPSHPLHQQSHCSSSAISLYHAATFGLGLGFCWSFTSCEELILFLSGYSGKHLNIPPKEHCHADSLLSSNIVTNHWFRVKWVHVLRMILISLTRAVGVLISSAILTFSPANPPSNFNNNYNSSSNGGTSSSNSSISSTSNERCAIPWLIANSNSMYSAPPVTAIYHTATPTHTPTPLLNRCEVHGLLTLSWLYFALSLAAFLINLALWAFILGNKSFKFLVGKKLDRFVGYASGSIVDSRELSRLRHLGIDVHEIEVMD